MHNIYTGYFAKLASYRRDGLKPYSITYSDRIKLDKVIWFIPSIKLIKSYKSGLISDAEYIKSYTAQLDSHEYSIMQSLSDILMHTESDIILLCYEKPGKFCHRHVLANWLSSKLGITIKEYRNE